MSEPAAFELDGDQGADWRRRVVDRSLRSAAERSVDRGMALIAAAGAVLDRNGGDDITVQAVADEAGQSLGIARTLDEVRVRTATLERNLGDPRYYLLLTPNSDAPASYQLTVAARRR